MMIEEKGKEFRNTEDKGSKGGKEGCVPELLNICSSLVELLVPRGWSGRSGEKRGFVARESNVRGQLALITGPFLSRRGDSPCPKRERESEKERGWTVDISCDMQVCRYVVRLRNVYRQTSDGQFSCALMQIRNRADTTDPVYPNPVFPDIFAVCYQAIRFSRIKFVNSSSNFNGGKK